jgi:predicted DNA-binding protein (UPF0251 family)
MPTRVASKPTKSPMRNTNELWEALDKLEPKQREVLIMIGASGLSYDEAAKICGCPTGTIKSRVNRARTELAHLLSIEGPEDFEEDRVIAAVIASGDRAAMSERHESVTRTWHRNPMVVGGMLRIVISSCWYRCRRWHATTDSGAISPPTCVNGFKS